MTSMQRGMTALLLLTLALPVASQAGPTQPTPSQTPSTWTQLVQDICGADDLEQVSRQHAMVKRLEMV